MNHKFYSVNVSNSSGKKQESSLSSGFILEKELKEIYETQYNDLFPKILSKTKIEFISLLKEQISLHLKIINKKSQNSLNSKYLEIYSKKYFSDKNKATKGLEELIKNPDLQENHLELLNCFIHCHKCSSILHKCKNKIILYKNLIYCLQCQKVYNENQIKLYCQECKTCYYTKLRYTLNKRYENFYPVSFKNYHCSLDEQEKIKCLECGHDLYYNITYESKTNRKNTITEVFCLKCKLLYDLNEIYFKCKICKSDFKSEAQLYSNFSFLKIQFLLIMHSLRKKINAIPEINVNRKCKCNIIKYEKYLHQNDNGVLYLGHNLEGHYVVVCDGCYSIFKYNEFLWNCPICGINFKSKKIMTNINQDKTMVGFWNKKNEKIEKRQIIFKSPSHMNIGRKKIIETQPTSAGLSKINPSNIVKNIFKRNSTKFNNNDKTNHKTKVILLTNNINSEKKHNLNLSEQKAILFKKINNINFKNNYFNYVNHNNKGTELRKSNFKLKNSNNSNTINSLLNHISFSNNKSESNTNKCTDSTANVTNNEIVSEKINEYNNNICRCPSCILENELNKKYSMDNNISRKLVYDDFIVKDKENNDKNQLKEKNEYIKKSKTYIENDNNEKNGNQKEIRNKSVKRIESRDSLINDKEKQNTSTNKKEEKLCKTAKKPKENIKFVVIRKGNKNHQNVEIKKIDLSLFNNSNKDKVKGSIVFDSIETPKNKIMKTELNTNKNNIIKFNSHNKLKINKIKSVKNINNIKTNNNINKINNIHPQNRIKSIKSVKYINSNNYNSVNSSIVNNINTSISTNKKKEEIKITEIKEITKKNTKEKLEKKPISKQPTKINSQNKNIIHKKNNSNKNNSIFDKIKQYYEDCINEEEVLFKNNPKNINKDSKQNKNNINSPKKTVNFKTDFKSDNYSILILLGRGTYGKTYLVEDPKTKERFALKKISINDKVELKENQDEYNLILKLTKDFQDLKIINIYGIELKKLDKYSTVMYVLMEAANCDWEKEIVNRCDNNAFYKEEQLMLILRDLVKTFSILQKNGISHRDVKPQNILCFGANGYKISDFGEAKNLKKNFSNKKYKNNYAYQDNTMKQTLRGTELYMSPILFQALRQHPYQFVKYNSYKSDVFSLGMCFFLASSLDYEGLYEVREITKNPKKTKYVVNRYLNMRYSQKYINLLISMLQINEKDRPDFIELEKIIEKGN